MEVRRMETLWNELASAFERSADRERGTYRVRLRVAGRTVDLEFGHRELAARLLPAMEHLADNRRVGLAGTPDLTVRLFAAVAEDGARDTELVAPWTSDDLLARGEVRGFPCEGMFASYQPAGGIVTMYDSERQVAYYHVRSMADLPTWEDAAPLRGLWHWWATSFGGQLVHGAAVAHAGEGILLAGAGGSGKSTTSINLFRHGWRFAGDDYVLLTGGARPVAHSLYQTAKLDAAFAAREWCHWDAVRKSPFRSGAKQVLLLHRECPDRVAREIPITSIVLPRVSQVPHGEVRPTTGAHALRALAPTTVCQLPYGGERTIAFLTKFVARVPAYAFDVGRDLADAPATLGRMLPAEARRAA